MELQERVKQAEDNLRQFGFAPITPDVYAVLLERGEFDDNNIYSDKNCHDCGVKMLASDCEEFGNRCSSCAWFEAMTVMG